MEEDIKIIKASKIMSDDIPHSEHSKRLRKALENLIKGYRELEKDLHEMTISNNHKKENWIHKNCLNDYIPKSKIKEIRDKAEVMDYYTLNNVIDDLTKLLGDEKQWKKYGET